MSVLSGLLQVLPKNFFVQRCFPLSQHWKDTGHKSLKKKKSLTFSVTGKINRGTERRLNGWGRRIIKTGGKKVFPYFSSCFPMERALVIRHSLLRSSERAWWDLELTTCVCLVTLLNDPNYLCSLLWTVNKQLAWHMDPPPKLYVFYLEDNRGVLL